MAHRTQDDNLCQCPASGEIPTAPDPDGVLLCARCHLETSPAERPTQTDVSDKVMTAIDQTLSKIDKDVYLVLRDRSTLRQRCIKSTSTIRNSLSKYSQTSEEVRDLKSKYGLDALCQSIKALIQEGILESEEKAREWFPDLFPSESIEGNIVTEVGANEGQIRIDVEASVGDGGVNKMKG